jgi:hypothetical protein
MLGIFVIQRQKRTKICKALLVVACCNGTWILTEPIEARSKKGEDSEEVDDQRIKKDVE